MYEYLEDVDAFWVWLEQCESLVERMGLPGNFFDEVGIELDEYYIMGLSPSATIEQALVLFTTVCRSRII